jgi:hypothetical protein
LLKISAYGIRQRTAVLHGGKTVEGTRWTEWLDTSICTIIEADFCGKRKQGCRRLPHVWEVFKLAEELD